jgi:hypothetical protein
VIALSFVEKRHENDSNHKPNHGRHESTKNRNPPPERGANKETENQPTEDWQVGSSNRALDDGLTVEASDHSTCQPSHRAGSGPFNSPLEFSILHFEILLDNCNEQ